MKLQINFLSKYIREPLEISVAGVTAYIEGWRSGGK